MANTIRVDLGNRIGTFLTNEGMEKLLAVAEHDLNHVKRTIPIYAFKFVDLGYRVDTGDKDALGKAIIITTLHRVPTHIIGVRKWMKFGVVTEYDEVPTKLSRDDQLRYIQEHYKHIAINQKFLSIPA